MIIYCHHTLITTNIHDCDIKHIHGSFLDVLTLFLRNRWYQALLNNYSWKDVTVVSLIQKPNIHNSCLGILSKRNYSAVTVRIFPIGPQLKTSLRGGGHGLCVYIRFHINSTILQQFYIHNLDNYPKKIPYCPFTCCRIAGLTTPPSGQVCHIRIQTSACVSKMYIY